MEKLHLMDEMSQTNELTDSALSFSDHSSEAYILDKNRQAVLKLAEKKRWRWLQLMEMKESKKLCEMICLPPPHPYSSSTPLFPTLESINDKGESNTRDSLLLDSIQSMGMESNLMASNNAAKTPLKEKNQKNNEESSSKSKRDGKKVDKEFRKPWNPRIYPASKDPPLSSPWYHYWPQSRSLWLANVGAGTGTKTEMIERAMRGVEGFKGFISRSDRPYILLIFHLPQHAHSCWISMNMKECDVLDRKIMLMEFARVPEEEFLPNEWLKSFLDFSSQSEHLLDDEPHNMVPDRNNMIPDRNNMASPDRRNEKGRSRWLDDPSEINGLVLIEDFLSVNEESQLLDTLKQSDSWIDLSRRRVQHHGYAFNYETKNVDVRKKMGSLPEWCLPVINKWNQPILNQSYTSLTSTTSNQTTSSTSTSNQSTSTTSNQSKSILHNPSDYDLFERDKEILRNELGEEWYPDQLTVNEYKGGQGIPHHIDTHSAFLSVIISVSLGGDTVMEFSHPDGFKGRKKVLVPRRSLLALTGEARWLWTHGITPRTTDSLLGQQLPRLTRTSLTFRSVRTDPLNNPCTCQYPPQCDRWRDPSFNNLDTSSSSSSQNQSTSSIISSSSLIIPPPSTSSPTIPPGTLQASMIEEQHVHAVYDAIADHFDKTRYKPWPRVVQFLNDLSKECTSDEASSNGSQSHHEGAQSHHKGGYGYGPVPLVADVGCDNGRYLHHNLITPSPSAIDVVRIGSDRSLNLAKKCREKGYEVSVHDCVAIPYRSNAFDASLSIAVLHHLSSVTHRIAVIQELTRIVKFGGRVLIYVWALEQPADTGKSFGQQDIFVPWTLAPTDHPQHQANTSSHTGSQVDNSSYEVNPAVQQSSEQQSSGQQSTEDLQSICPSNYPSSTPLTFQRYLHVYRSRELTELIDRINIAEESKAKELNCLTVQQLSIETSPPCSSSSNNTINNRSIASTRSFTFIEVEEGVDHGNCFIILKKVCKSI